MMEGKVAILPQIVLNLYRARFCSFSMSPLERATVVSSASCFAFSSQAVSRITERDGVSTEDALRRLQSQWPNDKQVEHANVVLSTLWEPEVTHKQVRHVIPSSVTRCGFHNVVLDVLYL